MLLKFKKITSAPETTDTAAAEPIVAADEFQPLARTEPETAAAEPIEPEPTVKPSAAAKRGKK